MQSFSWPIRVYIEDTDAGGIVFYANYLKYMERARTEALRSLGFELDQWQNDERRLFVVRSIEVDYHKPAKFNEQLCVHANMQHVMSFIDLVLNAGPVVQGVMAILVIASIMSWALILGKTLQLRRARREAEDFEEDFWGSSDISGTYSQLTQRRGTLGGLERIFEAGFSEFGRLRRKTGNDEIIMDGSGRAMRIALARETDVIEQHLPFLATVGSISPYIGLFGTVWGIMNSFTALGNVQQATLAMVAPGIAEALIATAIGLFAAIPAVIFYNRFATEVDRLLNRYENFAEEFSTVLQRQAIKRSPSEQDAA